MQIPMPGQEVSIAQAQIPVAQAPVTQAPQSEGLLEKMVK